MAKITALCNQKGGVGKTVTAVNLGIGLARMGKKVLLADIDAQGSLTASLGFQHPDRMEDTLATMLGHVIMDEPLPPGKGIIHHAEGVDLLPANIELSGLEVTLVNTMSRETILREYLNSVQDQYDVILLDCCPSLGMLTINALAAADEVVIPCMAHYLSLKGLEQLLRSISNVKRKINPKLEIAGILITMADMRTNYSREIVELLRGSYGTRLRIFDSIIPLSIRAAETSAEGRSIYLHDPAGKVSAAYAALDKGGPDIMKSSAAKIQMTGFDDLFQTGGETVQEVALSELLPFKGHPFHVRDDEAMQETAVSIAKYGVLVPGIVRPRSEGGYEIIAGHRRKRGSELAGKETMPVLVRTLDDDEATIIMVDSNLQREKILPSEKAFAYRMKLEALKHQGQR